MPGIAAGTLGLMAGYFVRTTAVLTLALLAAVAARKRPAAFRHFVLSLALIGLLLLPVLSLIPIGWESALLPGWLSPSVLRQAGGPIEPGLNIAVEIPAGAYRLTHEAQNVRPEAIGAVLLRAVPENESLPISPGSPGAVSNSLGKASRPGSAALDILVAFLWAAGLAVLILRLAYGLAGAVRLTAEGTPLSDPAWRLLLERFLSLVSLKRKVRLRSHPEILVPLTWGWRRPVVLFPSGASGWTDGERSSALFHELSHVKRSDFLVMMLVRTSLALFWWNPLCWVVYRLLLREQEIACDELVLRAGIKPSTYAASLLAFRRSAGFRWNPSAALLGMLGRSSFQERVAAILKQKLIFMEVKMRTKIMLALALVAAVALVGTARPAAGRDVSEAATVLAETALPAAAALDVSPPASYAQEAQTEKAVVQEKKKEQAKPVVEKKIIISPKVVENAQIVITITEGDEVKTLKFDKPLTITKGKDGNVLILSSDGKEIQVLRGEPLRLEVKGGELEVIKEGKVLKIGEEGETAIDVGVEIGEAEGKVFKIVKKPGQEGSTVMYIRVPEGKAVAEGKAVKIVKEGEPFAWVIKEGKPVAGTWVAEGGKAFTFATGMRDKEFLEKVRALQEQVQAIKAKKMDLAALEESLKKLEAELKAKEEKLRELAVKFEKVPGEFAVARAIKADIAKDIKANVWFVEKDEDVEDESGEARTVIKVQTKDTDGAMEITIGKQGLGREAYEGALANLKKGLPEGYKLADSKFDEEAGTMSFRIAPPEGKKTDEATLRKLVEILTSEIDKKK